jgi:hypothetical protein
MAYWQKLTVMFGLIYFGLNSFARAAEQSKQHAEQNKIKNSLRAE